MRILFLAVAVLLATVPACLVGDQDDVLEPGLDDQLAVASDLVAVELATLARQAVHAPPPLAAIDALVADGFPKPATSDPVVKARAEHAHATLGGWGADTMVLALRAATATDPSEVRVHALGLRAHLARWVEHGAEFGDRSDADRNGNVTLEVTWFLGNVARAAEILDALATAPGTGATGVWPAAERARFGTWAQAVADRYVQFAVFSAGLSNRKASQVETLARVAALTPDVARRQAGLTALRGSLRQLLETAIRADGFIAEDTCRDKYHEQFFLASALQAAALFDAYGLGLSADGDRTALERLAALLDASARRNQDDRRPTVCARMDDAHANHEIPHWALASPIFTRLGRAVPAAVEQMRDRYYARPGGMVMQWGFAAITLAHGLAGNVRGRRLRDVVEAEQFVAARDADDRFEGSAACQRSASPGTDVAARSDAGGGCVIDRVAAGEHWTYAYPVAVGGPRTVRLLVAAAAPTTLELSIVTASGRVYVKARVEVPATAGQLRWVSARVDEPSPGDHRLRVTAVTGGVVFDALELVPGAT